MFVTGGRSEGGTQLLIRIPLSLGASPVTSISLSSIQRNATRVNAETVYMRGFRQAGIEEMDVAKRLLKEMGS